MTERLSLWRFTALGFTFGLLVGIVEAIGVLGLPAVPGGLSWRSANGPEVLFAAPMVNGVVFTLLAILAWIGSRLTSCVAWDAMFVTIGGGFAAYLGTTLPGPILFWWAVLLASLGVAILARRLYLAKRVWLFAHLGSVAAVLGTVTLISLPVMIGYRKWRERSAMARLPAIAPDRPNLLLLVMDTQRADHLGLYGYERPTSPNLDRVGAQGLVYEHAIANSSWTLPSHATMMTGQALHEHRAGVMRRPYLDGRLPTVAEALAAAGYATGGFVANTFWAGRTTGVARGFIHYEDYYQNVTDAIARTSIGRLTLYTVLPRFGLVDLPGRRRGPAINREILQWIDGLKGRPFFAFANYFDVHGPWIPPIGYRGRFSKLRVEPRRGRIEIGALAGETEILPPEELQRQRDRYDESILALDAAIAELLSALEDRGLRNNTLVIITSDHGESFGEHGFMAHGHSLYRDQIDIPMILSWPARIANGVRRPEPIGLDQIPATLLDAAGITSHSFPGRSLLESPPAPPSVVVEVSRRSMVPFRWPSSRGWVAGMVTEDWYYIEQEDGTRELYDARRDVPQETNLATDPDGRLVADSLHRVLDTADVASGLKWP